ncbi:hypothetical protein VTN77DRAFT_352 [Rasamsonia byssochlamydoides]|uniref:uncharacterized protein n=1 Tax=Rasamsonia byssochlamydoides TaxID=89139 RepID=UPI0037437F51
MAGGLVTLHITCAMSRGIGYSLRTTGNVGAVIGSTLTLFILVLSFPFIRNLAPGVVRWLHRPLALVAIAAVYAHLPASNLYPTLYIFIVTALFLMLVIESAYFLYSNGAFADGGWTRVSIILQADESKQILVYPGRAIHVLPGQFIKLWIPFVSPLTWLDFRQFYVQSWEPGKQQQLQLFERAEGSFSRRLGSRATRPLHETDMGRAFFTGPYGISEAYTQYETILLIASDLGILSMMAHVRHLYHCIKGRTSKARKIRLVWQIPKVSKLVYTDANNAVKDRQAVIDEKLKTFSDHIKLPTKLIQYHLGRYVPLNDKEQEELGGDVIRNQARISNLQSEFQEFENEVRPLEKEIAWFQGRMRIMNNILCWINSKFDDIKDKCELHCTVYQQYKQDTRKMGRAEIIGGLPNLDNIFVEEVTKHRKRIADDAPETRGETLIMVSASPQIHDHMRRLICKDIKGIHLREFEYKSM